MGQEYLHDDSVRCSTPRSTSPWRGPPGSTSLEQYTPLFPVTLHPSRVIINAMEFETCWISINHREDGGGHGETERAFLKYGSRERRNGIVDGREQNSRVASVSIRALYLSSVAIRDRVRQKFWKSRKMLHDTCNDCLLHRVHFSNRWIRKVVSFFREVQERLFHGLRVSQGSGSDDHHGDDLALQFHHPR